jgi:hypothetical protein
MADNGCDTVKGEAGGGFGTDLDGPGYRLRDKVHQDGGLSTAGMHSGCRREEKRTQSSQSQQEERDKESGLWMGAIGTSCVQTLTFDAGQSARAVIVPNFLK